MCPRAVPKTPRADVRTRPPEGLPNLTLISRVSERTLVHDLARVSFTIPAGWTEIPAQRAARKVDRRFSTLLGVQHSDRAMVASMVWTQLEPGDRPADWVREAPAKGEYGEEYETLKAVYGVDRVSIPARFRNGPFDVYRIDVRGGSRAAGPAASTLFVFFVESRGTTWMLKARVTSTRRDQHEADALAVLGGHALVPDPPGAVPRKAVDMGGRFPSRVDPAGGDRR